MVSDMALVDLAATLSRSVVSATRLVGGITELAYRLPRIWARVRAGEVPQWRALRVAERTIVLPWEGAAHVDAELVSVMKSCSWAQVDRCVQAALERDPAKEEPTHADDRFLSVFTGDAGTDQLRRHPDSTGIGLIGVEGVLDTTDALDLEHAIRRLAQELAAAGSEEPLRVRRAKAVGLLARGEVPLPDEPGARESLSRSAQSAQGHGESRGAGGAGGAGGTGGAGGMGGARGAAGGANGRGRAVTLVLHLSEAGLADGDGVGRCENTNAPVSVEQIKQWCGGARVTVRPVLDLADHLPVGRYEIPDRLRQQVHWRDPQCVFPHCGTPARSCDLDHIIPHAAGGPTCACNLAPLCRRHHRTKTATRWNYTMLSPGTYYWRSRSGTEYVVGQHGTHRLPDLSDSPDHRILMRHRNRRVRLPGHLAVTTGGPDPPNGRSPRAHRSAGGPDPPGPPEPT